MLLLLSACASLTEKEERVCFELSQAATELEVYDTAAPVVPSGYRYCWEGDRYRGAIDRVEAVDCVTDPHDIVGACDTTLSDADCSDDSECDGGICGLGAWGTSCECYATCATDDDCAADEACVCAAFALEMGAVRRTGAWNQCVAADCRSDADCASGSCGLAKDLCDWGPRHLACRTETDACRADEDCDDICTYDGAWGCAERATCE